MQFINSIILPLALAASTITALPSGPSSSNPLPDQYQLSNMTWTGPLVERGPNVSFTGHSFEDIEKQKAAAYPGHIWPSIQEANPRNVTRSTAKVVCDRVNYKDAKYNVIMEGIKYLKGQTGDCELGPTKDGGPLSCTRVSCSWDSGIFFCNQNDYATSQPCNWLADYAQNILSECVDPDTYPNIKGQDYDSDGWSVIVGGQSC